MARLSFAASLIVITLLVIVTVNVAQTSATEPITFAPASVIGAGKPYWIDSNPKDALINGRVDIGTMHWVGDEIEAQFLWPSAPGSLRDFRASHPNLNVPEGSYFYDRERVVCGKEAMIFYHVESSLLAPDGTPIYHKTFNPKDERLKAEASEKELRSGLGAAYGSDPRSLVCWAAARKCEGRDFSWPPPPNMTPLEYSDRAKRMRTQYNRMFVPVCKK